MAKDYFQDIVPPKGPMGQDGEGRVLPRRGARHLNVTFPPRPAEDDSDDIDVGLPTASTGGRSIRNITPSQARIKMSGEMREPLAENSEKGTFPPLRRWGLWIAAVLGILVIGVFGLFAFRNTTVTVTPLMQSITFDNTSRFTAYPETTAASGTLPYKIISTDLYDSEPVDAQGMQHVETKSSGSITIYNAYSSSPVRLIKNTRFESPSGLIFRIPAEVVVPGMKGATPGSVSVTVAADQAGDTYNLAATQFTLPGLKSNAAMYKGVHAKSFGQFTDGFIGDQPAVAPATLTATIAAVRTRLAARALAAVNSNSDYRLFPDLSQITFRSMPSTTEAGGGVRIHERAHIDMVAFPKDAFTKTVAKSISADTENASITLRPSSGFAAHTSVPPSAWGIQVLNFVLAGQAQVVWNVDTNALARALAGRDESAFQAIITGFPGIKEAHARIQPFWKTTFPNPSKIKVTVVPPSTP